MPIITIAKKRILTQSIQREAIGRDLKAWRALGGVWRGKKIKNPITWQRQIRKEWSRTLP